MIGRLASVFRQVPLPASSAARTFVSFARPMPRPSALPPTAALNSPLGGSHLPAPAGPVSIFDILSQQRRFKSRGNTYQPSTLKRKRRAGFLARLRTKGGRKILQRRREKGRWFLTY